MAGVITRVAWAIHAVCVAHAIVYVVAYDGKLVGRDYKMAVFDAEDISFVVFILVEVGAGRCECECYIP